MSGNGYCLVNINSTQNASWFSWDRDYSQTLNHLTFFHAQVITLSEHPAVLRQLKIFTYPLRFIIFADGKMKEWFEGLYPQNVLGDQLGMTEASAFKILALNSFL